jgi:hypothetical protein
MQLRQRPANSAGMCDTAWGGACRHSTRCCRCRREERRLCTTVKPSASLGGGLASCCGWMTMERRRLAEMLQTGLTRRKGRSWTNHVWLRRLYWGRPERASTYGPSRSCTDPVTREVEGLARGAADGGGWVGEGSGRRQGGRLGKATNAREAGAAEVAAGVVEAVGAGEATGDRDLSGSRVPGAMGGGGEE